jgi:hypothetical protein
MSQAFQPPDQEPPDLVYSDAIEVTGAIPIVFLAPEL